MMCPEIASHPRAARLGLFAQQWVKSGFKFSVRQLKNRLERLGSDTEEIGIRPFRLRMFLPQNDFRMIKRLKAKVNLEAGKHAKIIKPVDRSMS